MKYFWHEICWFARLTTLLIRNRLLHNSLHGLTLSTASPCVCEITNFNVPFFQFSRMRGKQKAITLSA